MILIKNLLFYQFGILWDLWHKTMKYIKIILLFIPVFLYSQENSKEAISEQKPFDLPEAIIYGSENLNVKSGFKRNPSDLPKLSISELDSLNSLEKVRPSVLPVSNLPFIKNVVNKEKGYLLVDFGNFITSNIEAGYVNNINEFDLYLRGGIDQSRGHVENAQYSKINLDLFSDYIAPDKFYIFGGSKTRTNINFNNFNYTNYSVNDFENRNRYIFKTNVDVDGNFEGFKFETGAGFFITKVNGDSLDLSDQSLKGYLKVENPYNIYNLGFNTEVDLRNGNGSGNNYLLFEGFGSVDLNSIKLKVNAGYQLAQYFDGVRNVFKYDINIFSNISDNFTFLSRIYSGINRNTVSDLIDENRFINYDFNLDHSINKLVLDMYLKYTKDIDFHNGIGLNYGLIDNNINFINIDSSYFIPTYHNVSSLILRFDGFYNFNDKNTIDYEIKYNNIITDTLNKMNTYIPNLEAELAYSFNLENGLKAKFGLEYVGIRYVDLDNIEKLDPFLNMNIFLNYRFNKNLSIFAKLENIFNQDIILYNFYIERGIFGKIGVNYLF